MKISKYITSLLISLYKSIKRFPLTIALSTAFVIVMILISQIKPTTSKSVIENLEKLSMLLALGFITSICVKLYFEKKEVYKWSHIALAYIGEGLILILYYFFLLKDFSMVSTSRYIGVTLAVYLLFIFIPYLKHKENFELYVMRIFGRFLITIIYSIVLYGGLCAVLATIDKLLEIHVPSNFYYYTFLIVAGIFVPTYFLGWLPTIKDKFTIDNYSNIFKVLVIYIVMPLITIYTIILYIYFARIIITLKWPVGLISNLVLWYSVISAIVLFFISPLYNENKFANKFMKILPKVILPLILLMFFSIGIRIKAYGVTEDRYYVIALSLWVFGAMIYFSLAKKHKNIFLPVTLSIIIIISVLGGPISSYKLSTVSQNMRLEKVLVKNNMLKGSNIIKNNSLNSKDREQITSILEYFNTNHNLNDVTYLPKNFKIDDMNSVFGFSRSVNLSYEDNNFTFDLAQNGKPIDIRGYDFMFDSKNIYDKVNNPKLNINYDKTSNILKVFKNDDVIYTKDLNDLAKKLVDKYGAGIKQNRIDQSDMSFEEETSKIKIIFYISNLYGTKNPSNGSIKINSIEYYAIIKVK